MANLLTNRLHEKIMLCYIIIGIASLFYFGKNYTVVIETMLFTMSIKYKVKISHDVSRIYLHRRPIRAIKTSKIYIAKVIKQT